MPFIEEINANYSTKVISYRTQNNLYISIQDNIRLLVDIPEPLIIKVEDDFK